MTDWPEFGPPYLVQPAPERRGCGIGRARRLRQQASRLRVWMDGVEESLRHMRKAMDDLARELERIEFDENPSPPAGVTPE